MKWLRRNFLFSLVPLAIIPTKPAISRKEKIRQLVHEGVDAILSKAEDDTDRIPLFGGLHWVRDSYDYEQLRRLLWEEYGCVLCGSKQGKFWGELSWRHCEECHQKRKGWDDHWKS